MRPKALKSMMVVILILGSLSRSVSSESAGFPSTYDTKGSYCAIVRVDKVRQLGTKDQLPGVGVKEGAIYRLHIMLDAQGQSQGMDVDVEAITNNIGSWPSVPDLPLFKEGTIVVFTFQENEGGGFDYEGGNTLPIGMTTPRVLSKEEIPKVEEAIKKLRELSKDQHDDVDTHDSAKELFKSKNYFLWALGVSFVAMDPKPEDIAYFRKLLSDPETPMEKMIWLDEVLRVEAPTDQLKAEEVHHLLIEYLAKKTGFSGPPLQYVKNAPEFHEP